MPDFDMCNAFVCAYRNKCRRNPASGTKPNSLWQSWRWFGAVPAYKKPETCEGWMPKEEE